MTPQLALVAAIVAVLALLIMVSLVAGIAIAIVVLKATVGADKEPPL
jgi:hypothetical protein